MRLGILIRDKEYRDALIEKIKLNNNDIFVTLVSGSSDDYSECLLLTDIPPSDIDRKLLSSMKDRTVFLTTSDDRVPDDCTSIFKYTDVKNLMAELSFIYNKWQGTGPVRNYSARLISVCCETDAYSSDRCLSLARQIIYRRGGRVLVVPLSYINDYGSNSTCRKNLIGRLLYFIESGKNPDIGSFADTDSYGVSTLLLPYGQNPIAYLDPDELRMLIIGLAKRFDILIADTATCFSDQNISLMKSSDAIIFFENGRRMTGIRETIGEINESKFVDIKYTGEPADAAELDDCINRIFKK